MNDRSDFDQLLVNWFDEGPRTMPDRVVGVVAGRIARQPQRHAWRLHGRPLMNTYLKLAASLAAVITIAVVAWQLAPSTPGTGATPSAARTATPSAAPSAAVAPWWLWEQTQDDGVAAIDTCGDGPEPPGCAGELSAGRHVSAGFGETLSYAVPAGWVNGRDWANDFSLFPATQFIRTMFPQAGRPAAEIAVHRIDLDRLVCPTAPLVRPEPPVGSAPAEIVEHIVSTQNFDGGVRGRTSVTIGALAGEQIELSGRPGWTCETRPGGGSGPFSTRLIVLAMPDGGIVAIEIKKASFAGIDIDFDQLVREAMPIVESFRFGPPR